MTHHDAHLYCQKLSNASHLLRVQCESENSFKLGSTPGRGSTSSTVLQDSFPQVSCYDGRMVGYDRPFLPWGQSRFLQYSGKIVRFTNWAHGNGVELIDRSSKCVHLQSTTGEWQNAACDEPATVICEKRLHRPVIRYCPKHWMYMDATQSCYRAITRTNMTILDADNRCFQLGT
ncbi:lectin C-type domain protein, partial [Teladorsagia circumcincta]